MRRTATQDGELNGHRFATGDKVLLFYGAANRDPAVFADPHALRPRPRPEPARRLRRPRPALLPRRAPGPPGDRGDVPALFDRLPDLEVTGEPDRLRSSFVNGIKRLPARLTGAR